MLEFEVLQVGPDGPPGFLRARLRVHCPQPVRCLMLRCQVTVGADRRGYTAAEQAALQELCGPPERWSASLKPLLWSQASLTVPPFERSAEFSLDLSLRWDESHACGRYFEALREGVVPLRFGFTGSLFRTDANGALEVTPTGDLAADCRFRLETCQRLWESRVPILLDRSIYEALRELRRSLGVPTLEGALEVLLRSGANTKECTN